MRLIDNLLPRSERPKDLLTPGTFGFNGHQYPIFGWQGSRPEWPDRTFLDYIESVHERNGVVAAAVEVRALILSQLWFEWESNAERMSNRASRLLNRPAASTRPEFLKTLEYDASYHGSAYVVNVGGIRRLRPDHCSVILGSNQDPTWNGDTMVPPWDAEVVGLAYHPNSMTAQTANDVTVFLPGEFTIWSPEPDPVNFWRGTSWVGSVLREVVADGQALDHTTKFFENAATPNLVFLMDPSQTPDQIRNFADVLNSQHTGSGKAFKNMFLGGGTDVKSVGSSLESLNLKDLTGGFETRIALRARVPGVILGVREGYAGSSLNAGNYASARRMLADGWFSPTAESLCAALERIVPTPNPNAELTYDRRRVLFLQEDEKDAADIAQTDAVTMRQLVEAGYDPASVTEAVMTRDWSKLVHTGNVSVQLQPPGVDTQAQARALERPVAAAPPQLTFNMPEIPAPTVNVSNYVTEEHHEITVAPEVPVTVNVPELHNEAPIVQVNVDPTPVTVENTVNVDPTPVTVTNEVNPTPVTVDNYVETPRSTHRVKRDKAGNIVEITERPA